MGQCYSFKRPGPAPCVDKAPGPACLILGETSTASELPKGSIHMSTCCLKTGEVESLLLKASNAVPSLLDSGPCVAWPLPVSLASSPAFQPTSRAEHLPAPLHMLFPLLPRLFLSLFTGLAPLSHHVSTRRHFLRGPSVTVHVPLSWVLTTAHGCSSGNLLSV